MKPEILYHFTAERFLKRIKREGLTKGALLKSIKPPRLEMGWQWLTVNPDYNQAWAKGTGRLAYQRNEARLTVKVPERDRDSLLPWSRVRFMVPEVGDMLSAYGDPQNWWLYHGRIQPEWITEVSMNVERIEATL